LEQKRVEATEVTEVAEVSVVIRLGRIRKSDVREGEN
jgi:hypothetical protein